MAIAYAHEVDDALAATMLLEQQGLLDKAHAAIAAGVEELWTAFARGNIRLVADGRQLRVEPFEGPRVERLRLERAHRPIIEARLRVLEGRL